MVTPLVIFFLPEVILLDESTLIQRANHALESKSFPQALTAYQELQRRGVSNSRLYRNLGNLYLLVGKLPEAIGSYRKGLQLDPTDEQLRRNLLLARQQVSYAMEGDFARPPGLTRPPWLPRFQLRPWMLIGCFLLYLTSFVFLTRWRMTRQPSRFILGLSLLVLSILLLSLALLLDHYDSPTAVPFVVIKEDGVLLRKGNGLSYPTVVPVPLNRGVEAKLLYQRGAWLQIQLTSNERGWILSKYAILFKSGL